MSDELKPCPFCGEVDIVTGYDFLRANEDGVYSWHVFCRGCRINFGEFGTEDEAVSSWNTRVTCDDCQMGMKPMTDENMAAAGWIRERTCHATKVDPFTWGCSECGGHWHDAATYCPWCGAKVVEE